jgi:hypothetical protein
MKRQTIALVGFGLVLATPPLRGQERSYSATKEVVWNAVHEALSGLQISVTKEDKDKGEIQSDPAPTDSTYLRCELHVGRGRPSGFWFKPKAKLEVTVKERSTSETDVRIKFKGNKTDVSSGGFIGQMVCKSTGKLEETLLGLVQGRMAPPSGKP